MDLQWEMAMLTFEIHPKDKQEVRFKLKDNALVENKKKLEKVEKERDELKLTLEKFQNSSKSLNNLLESQVCAKFKTGLGYNTASSTTASPAVESFVNSSEMLKKQEYNKSKFDKGYHAVPLPYTGNFIPFKSNLTFIDEIVESENMDVTTIVTPGNVKKVVSNHESTDVKNNGDAVEPKTVRKNSFRPPVIEDWNFDDDSEVEFIPNVEDKTVRPSTEKIKFVKFARETVAKLEIQGEVITQEDMNLKLLRSLPSEWKTYALIWRNKQEIETIIFYDLYNNLKIYKPEISGSSSTSQNPQNVAFVSSNSTNSNSSTNEADNTAYGVSATHTQSNPTSGDNLSDVGNPQQKEYREKGVIDSVETPTENAFVAQDRIRGYDWSYQAEEEHPTNFTLMAHSSSGSSSSSDSEITKSLNLIYNMIVSYKAGLESVEARLAHYKKNEVVFEESINVLNLEVKLRDNALVENKKKLEKAEKERDELKLTLEKFQNSSKSLNNLLEIEPKTIKKNSFRPPVIEDWNFDDDSKRDLMLRVLTRSGKINTAGASVNTAVRLVNNADSKLTVNHPRSITNAYKRGYSQVTRPFNKYSANKNSIFNKKVNTARVKDTTARDRAVVSENKGKRANVVKASACWGNSQQKEYKEKEVIDSGCSRHMTGNKCYLTEYEDYNGGFVSFVDGKGRIFGKGKIKTGTLDFDNVYFCKELKYNLFSVLQICNKKNNILFTDTECLVLSSNFKLFDESQVLLRVPKKDNIYSVDLKSVVPTKGLTCLFAKATIDEYNLWHKRLGHINFKNINKLVRGNLVRGLPLKIFKNDNSCVACQKGKQHKASCKAKLVNSISKPLHMLHMDLFGPKNVKNLMKNSYCLVVTDDFSRFSWVFFFATKNETSGILKTFITEIENQLDYKVKVIRSDNGTEFKNSVINQFYEIKGIKREFSVARTPQHNGVAERRNRTLIEAARTMLVDSKLPTTFSAEAVSTVCYMLNWVLVIKSHNKTPYELIRGRTPLIDFMKPFGCHVTILNTRDYLGKFDGKVHEGFFVGYYVVSKAIRVFNKRTRIVEETLNIRFLENTPNVTGNGPDWIFNVDSLTLSMNYVPVVAGNQTNGIAGTRDNIIAGPKDSEEDSGIKPTKLDVNGASDKDGEDDQATRSEFERLLHQEKQIVHPNNTSSINTVSTPVSTAGPSFTNDAPSSPVNAASTSKEHLFEQFSPFKNAFTLPDVLNMFSINDTGIFGNAFDDEDVGAAADLNNLETTMNVSPIPITRIDKDHPKDQI
ncbi:putative ribonuclease H-like domain-containing protein, partial [Tanacetum coccineum]